ncbi:MAG: hypothetical protein SGBAC_010226 [Bacillariaceae sp.]
MTFSQKALSHTLGDATWLDRINPPHKEQTLHYQHLASTKEESNSTAKKPTGAGAKATNKQRIPTRRFYLDDAVVGANVIKLTKEWNDPSISRLDRLLILQEQIVTVALIVAGDESDPYITIVTNPSTTRIDVDDGTLGAPVWSGILSEELACKIGVPYDCPSHLAAAATAWPTSTDNVSSREGMIQKMQAVLLSPTDRFGTRHGAIHHVLLFPALICPPVGFFWPTATTFSEFVASIKALNEPAYASFLTVLDLLRSMIEQWFDGVNASPKDFCFRIQSAQPLMNVISSKESPNPDDVEAESRHQLHPILELVDQLLCFYDDDGVIPWRHRLIRYGQLCLWWVERACVSFLKYCILLPWKVLKVREDRWIPQSYRRVKAIVAENESYGPTRIPTQLDLALGKDTAYYEGKATFPTDAANGDPADFIRVNQASKVQQHGDEEKVIIPAIPAIITSNVTPKKDKETHPADTANSDPGEIVPVNFVSKVQQNDNEEEVMIPAIIVGNVSPNDDLEALSRCIVNGIRKLHGEKAEVVSCYFISRRKGATKAYLEFKKIRHARMALHLDGIQQFSGIISVQLMQPGENTAAAEIQEEKNPELEEPKVSNNDEYKRELCRRHSSGYCCFGDKCDFAHGVLDLRLNYHTKLHPERCLYIRNIVRNYPAADLMNYIRRKVEKRGHSSPKFTAIHVRGSMSDALVEFQEGSQASVVRRMLSGLSMVSNTRMEIYPWKPAYQNAFVVYFKEDKRIPIDVGSSKARNGATSEATTETAVVLVAAQETNRKEKMLRRRLIRAKQEINDLQEEKRQRDAIIRLLVTSLQSMKISLSAALSEIDLATQQIADIQQIRGTLPS